MNRFQAIALICAALNLLLIGLFPPFDYISLQRSNIPTFDGFYWLFGTHLNRVINIDLLTLEAIVVLINAAIAWLLLRPRPIHTLAVNRYQRAVLWLIAINLVCIVLFPPFQNYAAITKAALPSFEGFFFLFGDNSMRQLVTPILYLEVCLTLVNGGILWLLFKGRGEVKLSAAEIRELAENIRAAQRHPLPGVKNSGSGP
jgi:hypothetical protein